MAPYNDRWRPFPQVDHCSDEEGLCETVPSDPGKRGGKVSLGSLLNDPEHFMENFRL